ncbi:MAG: esterase/lipase family protein [Candidatus Binataceae bacterium]
MSELDGGLVGALTREFLSLVDIGSLLLDPVFYGIHVPPGDGKLVAVLPGLFGNDLYLEPLLQWLECTGYTPVRSRLMPNAGCSERLRQQVQTEIDHHQGATPRPVALIGHSRGGILAWAIAAQMQEQVSHLVLLGAPALATHPSIENGSLDLPLGGMAQMLLQASKLSRRMLDPDCRFPDCGCPYIDDAARPLSPATSVLSIYGRDDQLMPTAARHTGRETLEVNTSHVGLVYHPAVYRALGRFLARDAAARDQPVSGATPA